MKENKDHEYMMAVKAGDLQMLVPLYQKYRQPLMGFFFHLSGGKRELSEDLVQSVFLRLLKYRNSYRPQSPFRPWLYQMARNLFYSERDRWQPLKQAESILGRSLPDPQAGSHQLLEGKEQEYQLKRALQQLSPEMRELIILCKYQALPYREVGGILNISEGNVKVRLHRAVKKLGLLYRSMELEK